MSVFISAVPRCSSFDFPKLINVKRLFPEARGNIFGLPTLHHATFHHATVNHGHLTARRFITWTS